MFFEKQTLKIKMEYESLLKSVSALSRLSSDSDEPYLYYRMAENIFCRAFGAENLARADLSLDAKKDDIGFGLKTFVSYSQSSYQKISEFNANRALIDVKTTMDDKIRLISDMRNARLKTTALIIGLPVENMIYHCVIRKRGRLLLSEFPMTFIRTNNITIESVNGNVVTFSDGINKYKFNFAKSTLYLMFNVAAVHEFDVEIFEDPYEVLDRLLESKQNALNVENPIISSVCLPLYSVNNKNKIKIVPERSGLNQWNALGRVRSDDEIYIPIPAWIHDRFPHFFPEKGTPFILSLPNRGKIKVTVCQQGGKALMSNPNSALGKWILREILQLKPKELLSYDRLIIIGIDSVEISKFKDGTFEINFRKLGTFEKFHKKHNSKR